MRLSLLTIALLALGTPSRADNWPAWRGPTGQGQCAEKNLPTRWSATQNVKWKVPLPDAGNSTPVVWGDKVFLTSVVTDLRQITAPSADLARDQRRLQRLLARTIPTVASVIEDVDRPARLAGTTVRLSAAARRLARLTPALA